MGVGSDAGVETVGSLTFETCGDQKVMLRHSGVPDDSSPADGLRHAEACWCAIGRAALLRVIGQVARPRAITRGRLGFAAVALTLAAGTSAALQPQQPASWLDRPLTNWNKTGQTVPHAPAGDESIDAVIARCRLTPPRSTQAERAVEAAGWIPFWNMGQQQVHGDIEIVDGMRGADGMCRPVSYNAFVFVGNKFAGTLSPAPMMSRTDGASGPVQVEPPAINVEFSRYTSADPLCCPSSRMTVRYRIDRTAAGPVVVPVSAKRAPK